MTVYSTGETTKRKIIETTGMLAAEQGLDNVSTRAIAEASGENIGSIHYHFGGKDALLEAVVRDAISGCVEKEFNDVVQDLSEDAPPQELSRLIRVAIRGEINDLFRSDRPTWHAPLIYQLLQRDDNLNEIFIHNVMDPGMEAMARFYRILDPSLGKEEVFQRVIAMKMPIFAHAHYRKAMLKRLGVNDYSEAYLQQLEDLLVRQTLLLSGLPLDG